jgi:DNA-binding MarR family transcriptional regulator
LIKSSISHQKEVERAFELLMASMVQSKHRLIQLGSEYGLTSMQAMTLLILKKPKSMTSLTKLFNCDPSNITGIVDGLEEKNLASRFPSETDRRIKMINLSNKGANLRSKLLDQLFSSQGSVLFQLTEEELITLNSILGKILSPEAKLELASRS